MGQPEEPDDDRPWTEAQWEEFLKRSDARSAKFGELLETLQDHPDRDAIIDHEMGWDRRRAGRSEAFEELLEEVSAAAEGAPYGGDDEDDAFDDELDDIWNPLDDEDFEDDDSGEGGLPAQGKDAQEDAADYMARRKDALKNMSAYKRSCLYGLRVHKALDEYEVEGQEEQDEDLIDAMVGSMIIAAKLAGGHGMGYDDDALCGNIVCCKRSLAGAEQCLRGLHALSDRGVVPPDVIDPLIQEGQQVRQLVEERIAELRSRVWWE